jgi:hypothetical protein
VIAATDDLRARVGTAVHAELGRIHAELARAAPGRLRRSAVLRAFEGEGVARRTLFRWVDAAAKTWHPADRAINMTVPPGVVSDAALPMVIELHITTAPVPPQA